MSVKYAGFDFVSKYDKITIDAMAVIPDGEILGVVQICHGMCEHKERYYNFMEYLAGKGYLCVIHDHRGHGESVKSQDDWGYFYESGYVGFIEDVYQIMSIVKENIKGVPYILVGHSMGSMIARCFVKKYDNEIDKLVLLGSPSRIFGVELCVLLCKILEKIKGEKSRSKLLDYIVIHSIYEKRFKSEKILNAWICSDRKVVEEYNQNPKCRFTFTISGYRNLSYLLINTYKKTGWKVSNPNLPILFISGKEDPCHIKPELFGKSVHTLKDIGYKNITAGLYSGMRHELLNEKGQKRVYKDIYNFISK